MKKYYAFVFFGLAFFGFVAMQLFFDKDQGFLRKSVAELPSKPLLKTQTIAYQDVLKKAEWMTVNRTKIKPLGQKSKTTIINFWASWCIPCLTEMPSLVKLKKQFSAEDLTVITVNLDDTDQMKNFQKMAKKFEMLDLFTHVLDQNAIISGALSLEALPVTIIIKKDQVVEVKNGPVDFESGEFVQNLKKYF